MVQPHDGQVELRHGFGEVWNFLRSEGEVNLQTSVGTLFTARAATARDGRQVIRFFQNETEYGRSYECCWGHYYNCNQTRIGMYTKALDHSIHQSKSDVAISSEEKKEEIPTIKVIERTCLACGKVSYVASRTTLEAVAEMLGTTGEKMTKAGTFLMFPPASLFWQKGKAPWKCPECSFTKFSDKTIEKPIPKSVWEEWKQRKKPRELKEQTMFWYKHTRTYLVLSIILFLFSTFFGTMFLVVQYVFPSLLIPSGIMLIGIGVLCIWEGIRKRRRTHQLRKPENT